MGLNNSNKTISIDRIDCSGSLKVTLALSASPDISSTPTDIVLVLDRSGSMSGSPLTNMKTARKNLSTSSTRPPTARRTARSAPAAGSASSALPTPPPRIPS